MSSSNRYAKGKVYRLVNSVDNEEYVGSTCDTLPKRLYKHKYDAKLKTSRRVYQHMNAVGLNNVDIVLVEEFPCNNKMELLRRERYWVDELKPTLNKNIPARTKQEYYTDNIDKMREISAKHYADNAEKIKRRVAKYREKNSDMIKEKKLEYRARNADMIKNNQAKWRAENADKVRENKAKYYAENAEKIKKRVAEYNAKKKAARDTRTYLT